MTKRDRKGHGTEGSKMSFLGDVLNGCSLIKLPQKERWRNSPHIYMYRPTFVPTNISFQTLSGSLFNAEAENEIVQRFIQRNIN